MVDLSGLNPQQYNAATSLEGALLVLAGAGSGKTRTITFRIAHLLDLGVPATQILALSFTNKAATEMRHRVMEMVGRSARDCVLSTFHSLGVRFLREEATNVGLAPGFTIMDEADQRDAVRRGLQKLGFDPDRYDPEIIHSRISHHKGRMTEPDPRLSRLDGVVRHVLPLYQQRLRAMNGVDFDDLIAIPVRAMEQDADIAQRWGHRFKYVMVDEYQDTNGAQLRMVKGLVRGYGNVCVVGDDDQSIYAWRGAVAGNILEFDKHFDGARMISLTQNYRSTNNVLRAANHVIRNNAVRHEKTLWSENGDGPLIRYERLPDDDTEAHWIATDLLAQKRRLELHWRDLSILYRTNVQSRGIEDAVRAAGIPYKVIGGQKFYDRKEVRDAVGYLRVIANPYDEAAWRRIINYPARGIGDVSIQRIADTSAATGEPFWVMVAEPHRVENLKPRVVRALLALHDKIEAFRVRFAQEDLAEVCRDLVRSFGFADELVRTYKDSRQIRKRLENVKEVASGLRAFLDREPGARLEDFLARQSLDTRKEEPGSEDADEVSLMTLHGSKGLEFKAVWLCGMEEGLMPHQRVLDGEGEIAEERRLAYVGITRAKRHLTLTGADRRLRFGRVQRRKPSRFLLEIPENLIAGGYLGRAPKPTAAQQKASARSAFASMLGTLSDDE